MLKIINLKAGIEDRIILNGLNLTIHAGETHALMGPNGSGKSTLAAILTGREEYQIHSGEILYMGENLLDMPPEVRAQKGIFLAFQYPIEIAGISMATFLKESINAIRKANGLEPLDSKQFLLRMKEKMALVNMDKSMAQRSVNEGFSGGEKKRNEIFQMAMLEPRMCILDETDSGLDIDAMRIVANGVNAMRNADRSFLVITHYQRLLDYIVPDVVHVLYDGRIVKSGDKDLALQLEEKGYDWLKAEIAV